MALTSIPRPGVCLDKDGTLVENVPFNIDPARIVFTRHAFAGLRLLQSHGYPIVVVTNQPGVAYGRFAQHALVRVHDALRARLAEQGIALAGFFACPHHPKGAVNGYATYCVCRKPAPGLLWRAARELGLDLARSWMVGDILDDVEAGNRAGCRSILLDVGNETIWRGGRWRAPHARARDLLEAAERIVAADRGASPIGSGAPHR